MGARHARRKAGARFEDGRESDDALGKAYTFKMKRGPKPKKPVGAPRNPEPRTLETGWVQCVCGNSYKMKSKSFRAHQKHFPQLCRKRMDRKYKR